MSRRLKTYLRTFRKRTGFTQAEVAFLFGWQSSKSITRHEWARREPVLRTVLAYEVLFAAPVSELFAGVYDEVELAIIERAHALYARLEISEPSPRLTRKLAALRRIMDDPRSARRQ